MSVGAAREADLWDFCGLAEGFRRLTRPGIQRPGTPGCAGQPGWLGPRGCPAVEGPGRLANQRCGDGSVPVSPGSAGVVAAVSSGVGHDAVVGAAGAGAAGAGAVSAEHLRGGPAVEFHQVSLGPAAVQPGVAEVVPESVRERVHAALPAATDDELVDAGGGQRLPVAQSEPQLRPPGLRVPGPGPQVPVEAAGCLV